MRANSGVRTGDLAQMAQCEPQLTPVVLDKSSDPSVIYFPSCTRVERCGGCCMHDLLACEPTKTEVLQVKVMVARYQPGTEGFKQEGFKNLEIEKHSRCECRCKTKEEDCNGLQDYHPNECKCVCRNEKQTELCTGENRFWDPITCECHCRNIRECSTGFYYDTDTCSCVPERNSAPVFRVPTGFNWRNSPHNYDVSWSSNSGRLVKRNENSG
uniref:Platelet-derived growth factor (PDGF) family profile domain-containing protein n=1 Tax=Strigamia maritima TaxID=126957 RepID=T1JHN3_STRMM